MSSHSSEERCQNRRITVCSVFKHHPGRVTLSWWRSCAHGRSILFSLSEKTIASGSNETFFEAYSCPLLLCGLLSHSIGRFSSICGIVDSGLPCAICSAEHRRLPIVENSPPPPATKRHDVVSGSYRHRQRREPLDIEWPRLLPPFVPGRPS